MGCVVLRAGALVSVRPPVRVRAATFAQARLHVPVIVRGRGSALLATSAMGLRASLGRRVRPRLGAKRVSTAIRVAGLASPREGLVPVQRQRSMYERFLRGWCLLQQPMRWSLHGVQFESIAGDLQSGDKWSG